jgi:hypothetical protein
MTTSLQPNLHAVMKNVKGYTMEVGTKYRWARNTKDGITLQEELVAYVDVGMPRPERHHLNWHSVANVYKPKRGDRFVVEVRGHKKLFSFPKLREAMRMAKFLYQTNRNL